jgi:hypothetical protein
MQSVSNKKIQLDLECKQAVLDFIRQGGQIKTIKPRGVKRSERTYDAAKGKYSAWTQGAGNMTRGRRGVTGTVG